MNLLKIVVALTVFILYGCASTDKSLPEHFGFEVLSTSIPSRNIEAQEIYPLKACSKNYHITQGKSKGKQITHMRQSTKKYSANWVNKQGNIRSEYWRLDDKESIVMTAAISYRDRAISLFDPPIIVSTKTIQPGQPQQHQSTMRVVDLRKPTRQREIGNAILTIEYVDDPIIRTPSGNFPTRRIKIVFKADLRFADAVTITTLYISQDLGVIVREQSESISILGLPPSIDRITLVLEPDNSTNNK